MYRRFSLVIWALAAYLALMLLGLLFEPVLALWPHFFLLATQELTSSPDGEREVIAAVFLGVVPVLMVSLFRQRRRDDPDLRTFDHAWSGFWTTVLTLAGLTIFAFLAAWILGWQIGV